MKSLVALCLFCYCHLPVHGQPGTEALMKAIPSRETYSAAAISAYIQSNFSTDEEKLQAAYYWITHNIRYSTDSMYAINYGKDPDLRVSEALRRRKGVCENFAATFTEIALKCGIRSFVVPGYTKQYGSIDKAAHTWCVAFLNNSWSCFDPTWDIDYSDQPRYFNVKPVDFIGTHMPFDPLWQLLDQQVSHKDFANGNIYPGNKVPVFNFTDSINLYSSQSYQQQVESSISRMQRSGISNELLRVQLAYLQMEAGIMNQENDLDLYNAAVSDLNKAGNLLNGFIQYRNNRFIPLKKDAELKALLIPVDSILEELYKKLGILDKSPGNFQYSTDSFRERLSSFAKKLEDQKEFLGRYLSTESSKRDSLFYN